MRVVILDLSDLGGLFLAVDEIRMSRKVTVITIIDSEVILIIEERTSRRMVRRDRITRVRRTKTRVSLGPRESISAKSIASITAID